MLLVVATGLGGLAVAENHRADQARVRADGARADAARIAAVAADPDRIERTVPFASGGTGTVLRAGDVAVFLGHDLPELPDGRAYQLWRMSGQDSQSAGVLGRGGDVTGVVTDLGPDDAVGVSVEPESGSDQPTTDPVFLVIDGLTGADGDSAGRGAPRPVTHSHNRDGGTAAGRGVTSSTSPSSRATTTASTQ